MPAYVLPDHNRPSPFTPEDKIDHLKKFFVRTFGYEASELGTVEASGTGSQLVTDGATGQHTFTYARQPSGQLAWFMDGAEEPIPLRPGRAGQQMRELAAS